MTLSDDVTILRPTGTDAYGNPSSSFSGATEIAERGFLSGKRLLLGPDSQIRQGDRVVVLGRTYAIEEDPQVVRSPARTVLVIADLVRLEV